MSHPAENDLALLAGGDAGRIQRFLLDRHVRNCAACQQKIAEYSDLRGTFRDAELPELNWTFLAAEMRANIHLGLEAGACVRATQSSRHWRPRLTVAFASLLLLVGSAFLVQEDARPRSGIAEAATPTLQMTGSGVELRTGANTSLTLLNRHGAAANQTVSAHGNIGTRYIDGETGSVTINNVYLQ